MCVHKTYRFVMFTLFFIGSTLLSQISKETKSPMRLDMPAVEAQLKCRSAQWVFKHKTVMPVDWIKPMSAACTHRPEYAAGWKMLCTLFWWAVQFSFGLSASHGCCCCWLCVADFDVALGRFSTFSVALPMIPFVYAFPYDSFVTIRTEYKRNALHRYGTLCLYARRWSLAVCRQSQRFILSHSHTHTYAHRSFGIHFARAHILAHVQFA